MGHVHQEAGIPMTLEMETFALIGRSRGVGPCDWLAVTLRPPHSLPAERPSLSRWFHRARDGCPVLLLLQPRCNTHPSWSLFWSCCCTVRHPTNLLTRYVSLRWVV